MNTAPTFQEASERLELTVNGVAMLVEGQDLRTAFESLEVMQRDHERYGRVPLGGLIPFWRRGRTDSL